MNEERKQYLKKYNEEHKEELRAYKTCWAGRKRNKEILIFIKGQLKPINQRLKNIK